MEKRAAKHLNSTGHSLEDLSVFVLEQIHRDEANFHEEKESTGS